MTKIRFDNRVAVVTGAGGGLGRAYALMLANRGAKVVVNDVGADTDGSGSNATPAQQVVNEIKNSGGEAVANYDSVSEWESARRIIESAIDNFGRVDILINNAGILRDKSLLKMEIEDFCTVVDVHLLGTFFCTKAAFPYMKEQGYGRIISISSAAGLYGNYGQTNYGAAKMGIVGLMNSVKIEGTRYGISANTVVPFAGTRMTATVMPSDEVKKVKPEYVTPIVGYLSSEDCKDTGKVFTAGGGYFGRAAVMEGQGCYYDPDETITVEMVAKKIDNIKDLQSAREFDSAIKQTANILSRIIEKSKN